MNIIKILFLSLLISLPCFSQNNPLNFIQTKVDSSWAENIIIFPDSIYLSKNNVPDSCYIINDLNKSVYLILINCKSYSYIYNIKKYNEYKIWNEGIFYYDKHDSINVQLNPKDTIKFIIVGVNLCPVCKKQYNDNLRDTLAFVFSSDSNQTTEKLLLLNLDISLDVGGDNTNIKSFYLSQNFPNPFNPSTKIKFSIPHSSFVTLKVYDLLGREIATMVNEEKAAGNYEINFNANNLSSGVYFYRMHAGSFTDTKRLILLR